MQYAVNQQTVNQAAAPVQESRWSKAVACARKVGESLITWSWTKRLLYWIVMSAGTASELFFLLAAIWVSVNANVHQFMLTFLTEPQTIHFTYLATTGFVALPECIVFLSMVTTINHIKMWKTGGVSSVVWSILYGVPTLIFLTLSLVTIGCSVANVTFTMPTFFVVVRALAAFIFAVTAFMYHFLGVPGEWERLAEKDGKIAELHQEINRLNDVLQSETARLTNLLQTETARFTALIEKQNTDLQRTKRQQEELQNALTKSEDDALQAYTPECVAWLKSGIKSADVEAITSHTGLSTAKVNNAIKRGDLRVAPNNKGLILLSSLVPWLQNIALPERKTDVNIPALRLVNN